MTESTLKRFLEIPYEQLEELNLAAKDKIRLRIPPDTLKEEYLKYLRDTKTIKAVTVCFSDIEGRFHMLDYDKKYLLKSMNNLTFDGSSVKGFSDVMESDLRLGIDWSSFRWLPSDVFGSGKVIVFANIFSPDGNPYPSDMRYLLKQFSEDWYAREQYVTNVSVECEGFLFQGINAEQRYSSHDGFQLVSSGGYFNSLPNDPLRTFIDRLAETQRALGFENEKDHPEVAPSQFELNYTYCEAVIAADLVQLYKLVARQVAANMGFTASFLPKPIAGINGSGMHCNVSVSRDNRNLFFDHNGLNRLSSLGQQFIERILKRANDLCLIFNPSVNAYRRLDPHYEAPNQIKSSSIDRTAMIRIPAGNEQSARIEIRSVAPDANPYLTFLAILKTALEPDSSGTPVSEINGFSQGTLPDNIYDACRLFSGSDWIQKIIGAENVKKFSDCKTASANRCPKELGKIVKTNEVLFHHEVVNQFLWNHF